MIGLIRNELMKIFSRISSWVYIAVLVVGVLAGAIIYQNVYDEPNENFLAETEAEIAQLKGQLRELKRMKRNIFKSKLMNNKNMWMRVLIQR